MKALKDLTNTEKARLLHDLFPDEIPAFLENLDQVCCDFQTHKEEYAENWGEGFIPFNYWLSLSIETMKILERHKFNMKKSSRVFSDQLFYTYTSLFVNDRIIKYADQVCKNEKFKLTVDLLYK